MPRSLARTETLICEPYGSERDEPPEACSFVGPFGYQDDDGVRTLGAGECCHGGAGYSECQAEDEGSCVEDVGTRLVEVQSGEAGRETANGRTSTLRQGKQGGNGENRFSVKCHRNPP